MIFRRPSPAQLRKEWRTQTRLRLRFERCLEKSIAGALARSGRAVIEATSGRGQGQRVAAVDVALRNHAPALEKILNRHYRGR